MASSAAYPHDPRVCIWPVYINANATLEEGRKLPKKWCVEDPQLQEIMDVLTHLEFEFMIEDKTYPRDLAQRGRIRVVLKNAVTGEPVNDEVKTRKDLLRKLGEMIPNLKVRKEGKIKHPGWMDIVEPGTPPAGMMPAAVAGAAASPGGGSGNRQGNASSSKKKKKG
ncbi:hypothetical protein AB1Y20_020863 [Prymnesium parvum]|uniref:Signal recognition particle 19 kDa protein n=1 Tax=Prymnesium parvum TaxID=97485 RepID=A0AB34JY55_PRYPA|mmetsp:Transcript_7009/g.17530  ORF Transcript_7009/g.17530 Transcript_7009/m.17530 type:complete len:167 (-) Transcript_7009:232-732(-)